MPLLLDLIFTLLYIPYAYIEAGFRLVVPRRPKCIRGQVALVTGGGKGIGRHIAIQLAAKGATVILWDTDEDSNLSAVKELEADGKVAYAYTVDMSDFDQVRRAAAQVRQDVGNVDILVNGAGVVSYKRLLDLTEKDIRNTLDTNLLAHYWTIKEFLPIMMKQNKGHIVNVASLASLMGADYTTEYGASKYGVRGMTNCLERELRAQELHGIKLTTVYPGMTNTTLLNSLSAIPDPKFVMEPTDVAAVIIDGIQQDSRQIFVPSSSRAYTIIECLLPWKAYQVVLDFVVKLTSPVPTESH